MESIEPHTGALKEGPPSSPVTAMALASMLLLFLLGCSSGAPLRSNLRPATIDTWYATNRDFVGDLEHGRLYGTVRDSLKYGFLRLSHPASHAIGSAPVNSELRGDSLSTFGIREHRLNMRREEFFAGLLPPGSPSTEILLYVHGFNTTFEEAAVRMARVARDLDFEGRSLFFSWPSCGERMKYVEDQNNTDWSMRDLKSLLGDLARRSAPRRLSLLAHSMGNREALGALRDLLRESPELKNRFRVIVLAAPDVDATIFEREYAPMLADTGAMVTIYVSRRDKAMNLSKRVNGYVRLGGVERYPVVFPGIDTVDVSNVDAGYVGHSYYCNSRQVLADLYYIIHDNRRPAARFSLSPVEFSLDGQKRIFWIMDK